MAMICKNCGEKYRPASATSVDIYRCPECGALPDEQEQDDYVSPRTLRSVGKVFTNCNVCGILLRTFSEERMGMCEECADE